VLACVLGGAQSISACSYDEAVSLPSEEAVRVAVNTQNIVVHETDVANVVDPLAGSYYIETLTNKLEEEVTKILEEIKERGGMWSAIASGLIWKQIQVSRDKYHREMESKKKILVGVNEFQVPEEEVKPLTPHRMSREVIDRYIAGHKKLRETRDNKKWKEAMDNLYSCGESRDKNMMYPMIEAAEADATVYEIRSTFIKAGGLDMDLFDIVTNMGKVLGGFI
jgi:methylmalonyl-CoA mutase N-terminal domain/subunit